MFCLSSRTAQANRKQATGLAAAESVYMWASPKCQCCGTIPPVLVGSDVFSKFAYSFEQRMRPGYGEGRSVKEVMCACCAVIRGTMETFIWPRDLTNRLTLSHRPNHTHHAGRRQWKPVRVNFLSSDGTWRDICKSQHISKLHRNMRLSIRAT